MAQKEVYREKAAGERESRIRGGMALCRERGGEIVAYLDGAHGVPSATEEGLVYRVDLEAGTCGCKDHQYRGTECMHQFAAVIWAAKHTAPFEAPTPRRNALPAPHCRRDERRAA